MGRLLTTHGIWQCTQPQAYPICCPLRESVGCFWWVLVAYSYVWYTPVALSRYFVEVDEIQFDTDSKVLSHVSIWGLVVCEYIGDACHRPLLQSCSLVGYANWRSIAQQRKWFTGYRFAIVSLSTRVIKPWRNTGAMQMSGQIYYHLSRARQARRIRDVVLVRLEQIAPFPHDLVSKVCVTRFPLPTILIVSISHALTYIQCQNISYHKWGEETWFCPDWTKDLNNEIGSTAHSNNVHIHCCAIYDVKCVLTWCHLMSRYLTSRFVSFSHIIWMHCAMARWWPSMWMQRWYGCKRSRRTWAPGSMWSHVSIPPCVSCSGRRYVSYLYIYIYLAATQWHWWWKFKWSHWVFSIIPQSSMLLLY